MTSDLHRLSRLPKSKSGQAGTGFMDRETWGWGLVAVACSLVLAIKGLGLLPLGLFALAVLCAAHRPSRNLVTGPLTRFVEGRPHRWLLIGLGATLLWQLVGVELALLLAGDVLAYIELMAAVGLISANARLAPVKAAVLARVQRVQAGVGAVAHRFARSVRAPRRARPRRPKGDDGAPGWAYA